MFRRLLGILTLSVAASAPSVLHAASCETIAAIYKGMDSGDSKSRQALAQVLNAALWDQPQCGVAPEYMHWLTRLLDDPDDVIKYAAANGLGSMGTRAMAAVPALEKALAKARTYRKDHEPPFVLDGSRWWGDEVLHALEIVTARKYPALN